ncbi:TonB-dependent receptor [Teredinibacter haidensis]|uniref:TonB-dependent receptor n=1 Tax=Teredinibacter haidensis TaxID=2731755 RepID=UPI000A820327|nr:TonB-dependent receptor [Teredinibacter haidensis]
MMDNNNKNFVCSVVCFAAVTISPVTHADDTAAENKAVEQVFVTTTREEKKLSELSESVGVLTDNDLKHISPSHPAEALNRIAGVHINNLGGEGHMTAIRQPITTAGVYLFLEDSIPTRPTGFFNHNGLYEINIPQSSRIEVIKGPASALYGSDAIGGVINVITKKAPDKTQAHVNLEAGSYGWRRGLFSGGGKLGEHTAARIDFNYTDNEGFRDEAKYDRSSVNIRLDSQLGDEFSVKFITSYSEINQAGVSSLEKDDYENNVEKNFYHSDIGFREVEALRLSAEMEYMLGQSHLFTATPFYRDNTMLMMPSWMVTYDPNIREYGFQSYGALLKYRYQFAQDAGEIILGLDVDSTPSDYLEEGIEVTHEDGIFTRYERTGTLLYDFEATQTSKSPYVHGDFRLTDQWLVNAGVRYDRFEVDYNNRLPESSADYSHRRPESRKLSYENTSPKLGVVYQFLPTHNAYANYRYAFRAPTVGALFRPGSSRDSTQLRAVNSTSAELGFRGVFHKNFSYEVALYDMNIEDDIVSIIDDDTRRIVNAGETQHKGVELGFDWVFSQNWQLGVSYTNTDQSYKDFSYVFFSRDCFCNQQINFAGNQVAKAPDSLTNMRLAYTPQSVEGLRVELEWVSMGEYFTDQTNTQKYDGHNLLNLRVNYDVNDSLGFYARLANITDERYSTYTSNQVNDPDLSYRPGKPQTLSAGFNWSF